MPARGRIYFFFCLTWVQTICSISLGTLSELQVEVSSLFIIVVEVEYSRNITLVIATLVVLFSGAEIDFKFFFLSSWLPPVWRWSFLLDDMWFILLSVLDCALFSF